MYGTSVYYLIIFTFILFLISVYVLSDFAWQIPTHFLSLMFLFRNWATYLVFPSVWFHFLPTDRRITLQPGTSATAYWSWISDRMLRYPRVKSAWSRQTFPNYDNNNNNNNANDNDNNNDNNNNFTSVHKYFEATNYWSHLNKPFDFTNARPSTKVHE